MTIATGQPLLASDINNLTFFPKGAILTFSSTAWGATSAEFKNIWKICNTANHQADPNVPDLTNRFLRGGASSDFTTGGGADSRDVILAETNLPSHKHAATGLSLGSLSTSGLSATSAGSGHVHSGTGTTNTGSGGHKHDVSGSTGNPSKDLTGEISPSGYYATFNATGIFSGSYKDGSRETGDSSNGGRIKIDATHSHGITGSTPDNSGIHAHNVDVSIPEGGSHSHTISGSITGGSIGGTTANAGDGTAFSVSTVPAYYTVIYIIKVA
jgi:hypothetical protein